MNKSSKKPAANDAAAPQHEGLGDLLRKHPAAFIAGGVILGVVAGALLPRGTGRRIAKGAVAAAVAAGQAGIHLSQNARDTAEDLTKEGREAIGRNAAVAQRRASELAGNARDTGSRLVEQAVELASRVRQ